MGGFGGEGDVSPVPNGPTNFVSSTKTIWLLPSTTLKNGGKGQNQKKDTPSALGMIARKREKEGENDLGGCPYRASLFFCAVCYTPLLFTFPPPENPYAAAVAAAAHRNFREGDNDDEDRTRRQGRAGRAGASRAQL